MKKIIFICFISMMFVNTSFARLLTDSINVLFVGNTYTCYHRLPWLVQGIAHSNGIPMAVKVIECNDGTLKGHATNEETINTIKQGIWDYVVLQEESEETSKERKSVMKNVYPYAQQLDSIRRVYNPNGETVFYMTWGDYTAAYPVLQKRQEETYQEMAQRFRASCAPVGLAWKQYFQENHSGLLHDDDKCHPNLRGSYLAANVFFTTFFGKPYQSDFTAGLPEEDAIYLQELAQKVVFEGIDGWRKKETPNVTQVSE